MDAIGNTIINTTEGVKNVQKDFQSFTSYNDLFLIYAAAICVGMATKDLVTDIMNEAILPLLVYFGERGWTYFLYKKLIDSTLKYQTLNMVLQKFGKLIWLILIWLFILFITYVIFKKLIKIDLVTSKANLVEDITRYVTKQEKRDYNKYRVIAEENRNNTIPAYIF